MIAGELTIQLPTTASEWVALIGGTLGAVLGIRAEMRARRSERPRLKVIPLVGFADPNSGVPPVMLGVEVINIGAIPVTIDQVGFNGTKGGFRYPLLKPIATKQIKLPYTIEPHTSQTFYGDPMHMPAGMIEDIRNAFVMTATDVMFTGRSKALKKVVSAGRLPRSAPVFLPAGGIASSRELNGWDPDVD